MSNHDKTFTQALRKNIEGMTDSAVFLDLWSSDMKDFEADPWPAIQLAIAILLNKPIILGVLPGREESIPPKLRKIADLIIIGDTEAIARGAAAWMADHER